MKKNTSKVIYTIRIILFIIHILMLYMIIPNIVNVGLIGHVFIIIEVIYIMKIILELLSKKECYKDEAYYNIMQIGFYSYIVILWSKLYFNNELFTIQFVRYLKNNYIILSILIIFLILYGILGINNGIRIKNYTKLNK